MKKFILLVFLVIASPVAAGSEHCFDRDIHLFVEKGDSLILLFADDWNKVYSVNKQIPSPDKLVTGQRLLVPAGTYLTDHALEKIKKFYNLKQAARATVNNTTQILDTISFKNSTACQKAEALLKEAKKRINGEYSTTADFLSAFNKAKQAEQMFEVIQDSGRKIAGLNQEIEKHSNLLITQKKFLTGSLAASMMFLLIVLIYRHKTHRLKKTSMEQWFLQHKKFKDSLI